MLRCEECGEVNPGRARFCLACGTALTRSAPPVGESRRVVTVLFCDVVGSTAIGEGLDSESVRAVMSLFFAQACAAVERHGGTVEKFIGDAVVGAFGVPMLHEDDALRGIRAALDLKLAVAELNVELERRWGLAIGVRIGINTGEVVAGDTSTGQAFLSGDVVNVAARLEQVAAEGEILVGEQTQRLVSRIAVLEPVDPLQLKGKARPLAAWRVLGLRSGREGSGALGLGCVGREDELAYLKGCYEQAVSLRRCRLATVIGVPGVGKSRLVEEFSRWVGADATVISGRSLPYGEGITFWPLAEALRDLAGIVANDAVDVVRAKLADLVSADPSSGAVVDIVLGVLGVAKVSAKDETFWAVRRLLEAAATRRPLVLVLDDLHWAEPTLIDLVEHVAHWSRDSPMLILPLARPEVRTVWPSLGQVDAIGDCLRLEPLGTEQTRLLAESLLGRAGDRELVNRVVQVAEGNPLFVIEILRMLVDDGVLDRAHESWRRSDEAVPIAVPASIQVLLAARLDRLAEDDRVVIERASVVGKQFFRAPVVALSPGRLGERMDEHLALLVARELVVLEQDSWMGEGVYRFSHLLIRDAAYQRLLKHERAGLHERMAEWLEARRSDLPGVETEDLLGYHLEQAHTYLVQLGRLDERGRELGRRAAGHLHGSGRRAMAAGDLGAAVNLLGRARTCLSEVEPALAEVLFDLTECLTAVGDVNGARSVLADLGRLVTGRPVSLAPVGDAARARVAVARCELRMLSEPGGLREDLATVQQAVLTLSGASDAAALTHALVVLGRALALLGRLGDAERELDRALVQARQAGDAARARQVLLQLPLVALWGPQPVAKANGRLIDTLRVLRLRPGHRGVEAEVLRCMGLMEAMRGRIEPARSLLDSAQQVFSDLGSPVGLGEVELSLGLVELMAGNVVPAVGALEAAYHRFSGLGVAGGAGRAAGWLAESRYRQGDLDGAAGWADTAAADPRSRDAFVRLGVQAKVAALRGDHDAARTLALDAVALVEDTDALVDRADALLNQAQVQRLCGHPREAETSARRAAALYTTKGHVVGAARAASGP